MTNNEVCTTQQAAGLLGISVTSVQQLVETGVLSAWKTQGGHRRIPLAAVRAYKDVVATRASTAAERAAGSPSPSMTAAAAAPAPPSILVVEDVATQRMLYQNWLSGWDLGAEVRFCENGYQALIEIARHKPDVLLADIVMEGIDGYTVIQTIMADPMLEDINIAFLSALTEQELEQRGGVPPGVVFFRKPIVQDELRGYLRACCAARVRRSLRG
ncbi:response regulator [Massilia sp. PWRC2]|uniref:response regulator n=1 Tax=Massilia sp. PWRC2 TaxID=2804626 RepID=UPI003CF8EAF1